MDNKENPKDVHINSDGTLILLLLYIDIVVYMLGFFYCLQHSDDAEDEPVLVCGSASNATLRQVMLCAAPCNSK